MSSKEEDFLRRLLVTIDDVLHPGSDELSSSGHSKEEIPMISRLRFQEQRSSVNRWSFSSETTAVAGGRLGVGYAGDDSLGGASSPFFHGSSLTCIRAFRGHSSRYRKEHPEAIVLFLY
jgi:hypothetical protein